MLLTFFGKTSQIKYLIKMNMPFPILTPRILDPKWFSADCPRDEEAELLAMEQEHQRWVSSNSQKTTFFNS